MSGTSDIKNLERRIKELENEVADRNRDLNTYKTELTKANAQLERLIEQIHQELKMANLLQRALVPTEFPNIPGFEFSTKFIPSPVSGGDYFDIFEHEDKMRFGIVLSSSTGYGMSSLFLSVLMKITARIEARKGLAPEAVLELMAQEIVPNIKPQDNAQVFYGVIDRRTFELKYASVGENIGLVLGASDHRLNRLENSGPALGLDFKPGISSASVALNPRDRLIFCSNGILRAVNLDGEAFGEERLYKAVLGAPRAGVHELRSEILYQLEKFTQGKEIPRDVTVVVIEVKDRVIKLAKNVDP